MPHMLKQDNKHKFCFSVIFIDKLQSWQKFFSLITKTIQLCTTNGNKNLSVGDGVTRLGVADLLADEADQEDDDEGGDSHATAIRNKVQHEQSKKLDRYFLFKIFLRLKQSKSHLM